VGRSSSRRKDKGEAQQDLTGLTETHAGSRLQNWVTRGMKKRGDSMREKNQEGLIGGVCAGYESEKSLGKTLPYRPLTKEGPQQDPRYLNLPLGSFLGKI